MAPTRSKHPGHDQERPSSTRIPALLVLLCLLGMGVVIVWWRPQFLPDLFKPSPQVVPTSPREASRPLSWPPFSSSDTPLQPSKRAAQRSVSKPPLARIRQLLVRTVVEDPRSYQVLAPDHPRPRFAEGRVGEATVIAGVPDAKARWVPPGSFMMGSSPATPGHESHEVPSRQVRISRGFWMWATEVTQAQYQQVMGTNPSRFQGCASCPVERVSWFDAEAFAAALSQRQGLQDCAGRSHLQCDGWRLPTEAEWAYAATVGATLHGGGPQGQGLDALAWYAENSGMRTHPVATKQPNGLGLYDMLGNVYEWCRDRYDAYPGAASVDPTGPVFGADRIFRGGSWFDGPRWLRIAHRNHWRPHTRDDNVGFRLVRTGR